MNDARSVTLRHTEGARTENRNAPKPAKPVKPGKGFGFGNVLCRVCVNDLCGHVVDE